MRLAKVFPCLVVLLAAWCAQFVRAQEPESEFVPQIEPASDAAVQAIAGFRKPEGVEVKLFAAEPMLANPVAFDIDGQGRHYVVETFRAYQGVTDIRSHMDWLRDDLASRTVEDRLAMYRKFMTPEDYDGYAGADDRIRRIVDEDGDGVADASNVFADGFNGHAVGIGAGVLVQGSDVYYTCIPDLWKLVDQDGDGQADEKISLSNGYGLHVGFLGHDLHGVIQGPDGRLYFSIGDRGLNVHAIDGREVSSINTGAILRCELDGSGLEIVATGLRNPQELAFDDLGNLFTVDNNSDSGDKARLVQVVEGSDSGWRIGWQFIEQPNSRGPWNAERMWEPRNPMQPAYLLPPIANISDGPSGLTFNPGTALAERHRGRFFLADFRGASGTSGVRSFALEPEGASFRVKDDDQFLWQICATDVTFGPDGAFYVLDWVDGWDRPRKGRIYRLDDLEAADDPIRKEVAGLLASDLGDRSPAELVALLDHADRRIRLEAQHRLAALASDPAPDSAWDLLLKASESGPSLAARRHAIWGLFEALRLAGSDEQARPGLGSGTVRLLAKYLEAAEPEVRAQAARACLPVLGFIPDDQKSRAAELLGKALSDDDPTVRLHSAIALGRLGSPDALPALLKLLDADGDNPYLRHAAVMGLTGSADSDRLAGLESAESPRVRMGALLALRRQGSPEVARFLDDPEPKIVLEAARAIDNVPTDDPLAALSAVPIQPNTPEALARRVVAAAERVGDADRLAEIAGGTKLPASIRVEAVEALANWATPTKLDRITGLYAPLPARDAEPAGSALATIVKPLLEGDSPASLQRAVVKAAGDLKVRDAAPTILAVADDPDREPRTRVAAFQALEALDAEGLDALVLKALDDPSDRVRPEALRILSGRDPSRAVGLLSKALETGSIGERQTGFATLAGLDAPEADAQLVAWIDRLAAGRVDPEVGLDILMAAGRRDSPEVRDRLAAFEAARPTDDPLAVYRETLQGGDRDAGERIFREDAEVACVRCHKYRDRGGEVGPDLTGLGAKKGREYLLQSIVTPNAQIAEGFETVVVATADGQILSGVRKAEDDQNLTLITPEAQTIVVPIDQIEERRRGDSAMPADIPQKLTKAEVRDLIAFLDSLR